MCALSLTFSSVKKVTVILSVNYYFNTEKPYCMFYMSDNSTIICRNNCFSLLVFCIILNIKVVSGGSGPGTEGGTNVDLCLGHQDGLIRPGWSLDRNYDFRADSEGNKSF